MILRHTRLSSSDPSQMAQDPLRHPSDNDRLSMESPQGSRWVWGRWAGIFAISALFVALLLIALGHSSLSRLLRRHSPAVEVPTLAVLPFDSLSSNPDQNFLAESMTEEVITNLGHGGKLRVLSRGSVMGYAGQHLPLERVASELHADAVFEGSITRNSGRIRVTANLYQVKTRRHLWAETYESEVGGGLDYHISRHFSVRVIQADYLRTRVSNAWFHDARLSAGIVLKF